MPPHLTLAEASDRLDHWFDACPRAAVALSGGVDSAFTAYWARRRLGPERMAAWTADSPSLKRQDLETARRFCSQHDIPLRVFATRELDNPSYASNPVDRCYFCKDTLYRTLIEALKAAPGESWICSGANHDDLSDYRPSFRAAAEARVRHPLLECGIGKDTLRALAREHGLSVWDKPSSPCLSSRIPYGQSVTRGKLARIEAAESWLQQKGFTVCRVRHDSQRAIVEVPVAQIGELSAIQESMAREFRELGFVSVSIDPEGFVSGKLNREIVDLPETTANPLVTSPSS